MARITVHIPDDVLRMADDYWAAVPAGGARRLNRSVMVCEALKVMVEDDGRPETSERGRVETLRSLRAARQALDDLEAGLTQAAPVQRRVRRYTPPRRKPRGA